MRLPASTIAAAATGVALLVRHDVHARDASDRLAAAALETLLNAIAANDAETGGHVRRVATFSLILADAADIPVEQTHTVERVALFHDIGKIHEAVYDIIHDPSTLTPAERRQVATHPQRGADVLEPLRGFYPDVPAGVLAHHERWDGTGYPKGISGARIPIAARIVAIADTFDAVTHTRRYRKGKSLEYGCRVIAEERGTQFDPDLADLFCLPPVFDRIAKAARQLSRPINLRPPRASSKRQSNVPEVSFRWRPRRA